MVKPLTVYKASAGSGKTFTLATEYIRLIVENPTSYKNILAVTFTNKATEEMKMRILSQLYGIWKALPESDSYLKKIVEKTGFEPKLIRDRAGQGLANLLHNYNYFRVETIDTFFQSVLRNMARELDLTTNLRIGLNDVQVEELAVDQLIADLSTTDVILQWIMKYVMESISDDKSWNVISQIKRFGCTIFKDEYKEVCQELKRKMEEKGFFEQYTTQLREIKKAAEKRMIQIGESFFENLEGEGLSIDDLANKNRGIAGFFLKLQKGVFDPSIENATVANCLENPEKWCAKTHPQREFITSLAEGVLGDILRFAVAERPVQWKLYKSADLTLRHLNQLRLLGSIEEKVRELNENNNRFLLSDTQQLLHALIEGSDSPFIFEKIGTQLEHVMIDEFQDTSTVQWQNFRVLLDEAMSHEDGSNLIVGDVKQSIYRWRSGDWRLLNDIEQQFNQQQIETLPLKTNYRSERNVISFNNHFFSQAAELEYQSQRDINCEEAEQLKRAYADVMQEIPEGRKDAGEVFVTLLPTEDYQAATLQQMADAISELRSRGVPQKDIAILVRMNNQIPMIAHYFQEQMSEVTIVSDEAFRLEASVAVKLLVSALRLLTHPDDLLTKAAIVKHYHIDVLKEQIEDNELLLSTNDLNQLLPEGFLSQREVLLTMPLYDLAERLHAIFGLEALNDQSAYVFAFYDQLASYVNENTADIDSFLAAWDEGICGKTIQSEDTNGVRILSIHKSKGLEFDYVICPFCDWQLEKQSGNILWCQPTEEPFSDLPLAPVDYSRNQMMGTIYEKDYLHEHLQNTVDNLNLLYVAFTRACKGLYVFGKRGAKASRSGLIEDCLPLVAQEIPEAILSGIEDEKGELQFSLAGDSRNSSNSRSSRNSGQTSEKQLQFEGVLYDEQITPERITAMLRKRLQDPRVADWFSPRWNLFNECTILTMEDGEVKERRPDRVMTDGKKWVVVDFKFGSPKPEYNDQVQEYMQLIKTMQPEAEVDGYLWFVYSNKIEEVV